MPIRLLLPLLLILSPLLLLAQDCNCENNLQVLHKALKVNYPGYADKTSKNIDFQKFLDTLKTRSTLIQEDLPCYQLLKRLVSFFKDPHLTLGINTSKENIERIRKMFLTTPDTLLEFPPQQIATTTESICGTWEIKGQGSYYKIDIEPVAINNFEGKIVKTDSIFWKRGQIKCKLQALGNNVYSIELFVRDHTPARFHHRLSNTNVMDWGAYGIWQRSLDSTMTQQQDSLVKEKRSITLKEMAKNTIYLRIPSFETRQYHALKKILSEKMPEKIDAKNLIIDVRGNTGGSTLVSMLLLPYVYKQPIKLKGSHFLSSQQNIADIEHIAAQPEFTSLDRNYLAEKLAELKLTPSDTLVRYTDKSTTSIDTPILSPKSVYILIDQFCASTTEYFLLQAIQNPQVKLVGQKTRGAIDYTDIGLPHMLPCPLYFYQIPMVRSDRISFINLDNIGISPNITLPDHEDALQYVLKQIHE